MAKSNSYEQKFRQAFVNAALGAMAQDDAPDAASNVADWKVKGKDGKYYIDDGMGEGVGSLFASKPEADRALAQMKASRPPLLAGGKAEKSKGGANDSKLDDLRSLLSDKISIRGAHERMGRTKQYDDVGEEIVELRKKIKALEAKGANDSSFLKNGEEIRHLRLVRDGIKFRCQNRQATPEEKEEISNLNKRIMQLKTGTVGAKDSYEDNVAGWLNPPKKESYTNYAARTTQEQKAKAREGKDGGPGSGPQPGGGKGSSSPLESKLASLHKEHDKALRDADRGVGSYGKAAGIMGRIHEVNRQLKVLKGGSDATSTKGMENWDPGDFTGVSIPKGQPTGDPKELERQRMAARTGNAGGARGGYDGEGEDAASDKETEAYNKGVKAGMSGVQREANPFNPGSEEHGRWIYGHAYGRAGETAGHDAVPLVLYAKRLSDNKSLVLQFQSDQELNTYLRNQRGFIKIAAIKEGGADVTDKFGHDATPEQQRKNDEWNRNQRPNKEGRELYNQMAAHGRATQKLQWYPGHQRNPDPSQYDGLDENDEVEAEGGADAGDVRIVYNKLLGGWYVVRGPSQAPLNGKFNSKEEAQAWLDRKK